MEKSLIAAMILDPDVIDIVSTMVTREDFTCETNRLIYDVIMELYEDDRNIDLISIYKRVVKNGLEDRIRAVYLAQICDQVIVPYPVTVAWMMVAKRQTEAFKRKHLRVIDGKKEE